MIEIIKAIQQLSANILRLRQDRGELINPELIEKTIRNAEASLSDNDSIIPSFVTIPIIFPLSVGSVIGIISNGCEFIF